MSYALMSLPASMRSRMSSVHGSAEILHEHDLAVGVAAGDGNDAGAERFRAVMQAEAAGEQAVAVGDLNDVAVMHAARREAAKHGPRPVIEVFLRVGHYNRFAGGAARRVKTHDLRHRAGAKAERIRVAQVRLDRERQFDDVVNRAQIGGLEL